MPDSEKNVRQSDVAEALGISQASVSLAMKGDERVSKKTRKRIRSKAKELGYDESPRSPRPKPSPKATVETRKGVSPSGKTPRIGQAQIAQELGLSQSTVSEALRGRDIVTKSTREAVLAKAAELGYTPDPNLVALSSRRSSRRKKKYLGTLAWVTNHDSPDEWRKGETSRRQYDGAAARSAEFGYKLEEFWLGNPELTEKEARKILSARGIRGLILAPQPQFGVKLNFDFSDFAAVTFGATLKHPLFHRVGNDLHSSTRMAFQRLNQLGYEKVGLAINRDVDRRTDNCLSTGYMSMKKDFGKDASIPQFSYQSLDKDEFLRWFDQYKPDAILSMSAASLTIAQWLEKEGLKIGKDLGIAVLDWHKSRSSLAGIDQSTTTLGKAAVNVVHRLLKNSEYGIPSYQSRTLIAGRWQDGVSATKRR